MTGGLRATTHGTDPRSSRSFRGDLNPGRITSNGRLNLVFYTDRDPDEWIRFVATLEGDSPFDLNVHVVDDPNHDDYWPGFYPTADD